MARLQSIVNALEAINGAAFQELCDQLIYGVYRNSYGFSRVGSQSRKQKTVPGTPDSLIILENGNYGFIEATTDVSNSNKLQQDIEACFNPSKVKIDFSKIEVVILCYNFEISILQMDQLIATGRNLSQTVRIDFWSLDRLALELDRNFPNLANRYLGLAFDTGQILPLDQFIREYQGAAQSIATPLDNEFVHREREQQELLKALEDSDLVVLTGAPGAGKTKLAVETIRAFCDLNTSYTAFAISDKDAPLHEDLPHQLDSKRDNILFVDDANRIETLGQIKGFFNRTRDGKLKMIATVRDYALEETKLRFQPLLPLIIQVDRFSDTDIVDIIKGKPFEILNPDYQRIIVNIAEGNPRLAIMASLLAKEEQTLKALHDVTDLFDRYFSTFFTDLEVLSTKLSLQCLGLVAFFHSIPKTRALLQPILDLFELEYYAFSEVVDALEKAELVQLKFDHIKIAEQNVGTFFFFKAFIQEGLLSLDVLFDNFYENNHDRFMDTIVPATDTFGYTRVTEKITPVIKNRLSALLKDDPIYFSLLNDFWYPLKEDVLEYVFQFIEEMQVSPCKNIWELKLDNIRQDEIAPPLSLIRKFLANGVDFKPALDLAFRYIEKNPNQIPHLIHILNEDLDIRRDDIRSGLETQFLLLNKLISWVDEDNEIAELLLLEMSKLYLSFTSRYHEYNGRNGSITIITLTIPNEDCVQRFREKIWSTLDSIWKSNSDSYFEVLDNYLHYELNTNTELLLFDAEHIVKLAKNHLSHEVFDHCKFIDRLGRRYRRHGVSPPTFEQISPTFSSRLYELYKVLDWQSLRERMEYEFDDYAEYDRQKEEQLRTLIPLENETEIEEFYADWDTLPINSSNQWSFHKSFSKLVGWLNKDLAHHLLQTLVAQGNKTNLNPHPHLFKFIKTNEDADECWELLNTSHFERKTYWQLAYFEVIDDSLINETFPDRIMSVIRDNDRSITILFDRLVRYLQFDPQLFKHILSQMLEDHAAGGFFATCASHTFEEHFANLGDDLDIIKRAYILHCSLFDHFDYGSKGLLNILNTQPSFLVEYVDSLYEKEDTRLTGGHEELGIVWLVDGIEEQIQAVFEITISREDFLGILPDFGNSFYRKVPPEAEQRAERFLFAYLRQNIRHPRNLNIVVDIANNSRPDIFEDLLLEYLQLNHDVEIFRQIHWKKEVGAQMGDTSFGDLWAEEWIRVQDVVMKSSLGMELVPIKKFLADQIESCRAYANRERERRFIRSSRF